MTVDELRAALEVELAWRQEELAFFKNQLNEIAEENKNKYRKSLVLILYSHLEGYIKICLQTYVQYINSQRLNRRDVNTGLMVASMHKEFVAYEKNIDDQIIDTESNLWYIVLQKNLYKVGLPIALFDDCQSDIDALVNRRNSIAHGNFRSGVTAEEFSNWETKVYEILSAVTRLLYDYANNEKYLA